MRENFPEEPLLLLSEDCYLAIRGYTAVPTETLDGGTSADRTDEFCQAANEHLPVSSISTESGIASEVLGDQRLAELDTNRLQLDRYIQFMKKYAELVGTREDLRYVSVGVDFRTSAKQDVQNTPETSSRVIPLLEIKLPQSSKRRVEQILRRWRRELSWLNDYFILPQKTVILQHNGGPNDFVNTQALELIKKLEGLYVSPEKVTITCNIIVP
jgi:hypothetical protein